MLRSLARVLLRAHGASHESSMLAFRNSCTAAVAASPTARTENDTQCWLRVMAAMSGVSGLSVATAYAESPPKKPAATTEWATRENPLLLYQYEVCPWCNKVKAVLDFHNAPYKTVEVDPMFKSQLKFSDYKKVPVLVTPGGEQFNDSGKIIEDVHASYSSGQGGWFGKSSAPVETAEVAQWRNWADQTLVNLVTVNVYRSFSESFQVMEYARHEQSFSVIQQSTSYALGGLIMYLVGKRLPAKYGYTDTDVREELRKEINFFIAAVGKRNFLGGKSPSLADLQVFGMLRAISTTDTFQFVIHETDILPWWTRMITQVAESSRVEELPELE